jgi:hypothetical protein
MANLEKELREFLLYSGQVGFYEDMMRERRNIRAARLRAAAQKAEARRFWIDATAILVASIFCVGIIWLTVSFIASYS